MTDPPADGREAVGPGAAPAAPVEALLVVDMQTAFVAGARAVPDAQAVVAAVDELLAAARDAGALIVHLRNDGLPGALDEPGTPGWELHRAPRSGEVVIGKRDDDGYLHTDLGHILDSSNVQRLAICGVMSEMCVAATARAALAHGYGVVLPHTAHGTYDVPPGSGGSPPVPAALAARAAEWSLGDQVEIVANPGKVNFHRSPDAARERPTATTDRREHR